MSIKIFLLSLCSFVSLTVYAQQTKSKIKVGDADATPIYTYVERMPSAGYDLNKYISETVHYPDSARAHNTEGRVIVKFVITETGKVTDCNVVKTVDKYLD